MSCLTDRLNNLDTNVYASPNAFNNINNDNDGCGCGCNNNSSIQNQPTIIRSSVPMEAFNVQNDTPTDSYALFTNALAPGETYGEGTNISFPTTVYNTDERNIERNNGSVMLSGGRRGKTYLVMYQVSGTFTDAELVITVNGVAQQASAVTVTGDTTASGNYIVRVPGCTESNISVNVSAGSVTTDTPTAGNNLTVIRIA